jgi:hypothetical protein
LIRSMTASKDPLKAIITEQTSSFINTRFTC